MEIGQLDETSEPQDPKTQVDEENNALLSGKIGEDLEKRGTLTESRSSLVREDAEVYIHESSVG